MEIFKSCLLGILVLGFVVAISAGFAILVNNFPVIIGVFIFLAFGSFIGMGIRGYLG